MGIFGYGGQQSFDPDEFKKLYEPFRKTPVLADTVGEASPVIPGEMPDSRSNNKDSGKK